jgi:two-component system cell cycle response regulator DivK
MTDTSDDYLLVVDDHELNLKLLQRVLELDGHDVRGATSLQAAGRATAHKPPALVVLDLNLPDGDGLELARRLKTDARTASCVVLACTADAMTEDRERALRAGCDAYVSKPIDTRDFSSLVASLLQRRALIID